MQEDAYPVLPFPPSIPRQSSRNHNATATEIHWNPPNNVKQDDLSASTPGFALDDVSPLKTRRLLPPSRRVDDGDDELGAESPPKVVRQCRIKAPTQSPAFALLRNNVQELSSNVALEGRSHRQPLRNASLGAPGGKDQVSESKEDADTFEQLNDKIHTSGRASFMNRIESARSMTSRSMASNSTQAELDFYMHRQHDVSQKTTPPQWIESLEEMSLSQHSVVQRRRIMLAKSAAMLRSNFPGWDRTESMRSFCSQTSSAAWSFGGSTIGGSTMGGSTMGAISRASCRSGQSSNTGSQQSRTPTPPDHVRMTSSGTTGKPRQMVTNNPVVEHAHRPVAAMPTTSEVQTYTPAPHAALASNESQYMGLIDSAIVREMDPVKSGNLLEDDDDIVGNLWLMANKLRVDGEPSCETGGNAHQQEHENVDNTSVVALGGSWQPHAGGSFSLYRRVDK